MPFIQRVFKVNVSCQVFLGNKMLIYLVMHVSIKDKATLSIGTFCSQGIKGVQLSHFGYIRKKGGFLRKKARRNGIQFYIRIVTNVYQADVTFFQ